MCKVNIFQVDIPEHKLQIWPGYKTTINQYEDRLLMVTEITHKVLRMDTVLQMLQEYAATKGANFKKNFLEDVVGMFVTLKALFSFICPDVCHEIFQNF